MKSKILKTVSILQAFVLIIGLCVFTMPMTADAASLGITPSATYQSSVYYQRACTAYESYTDPVTRFVQVALSQAGYKGGTYSGDWAGVGGSNGKGGMYTEYSRFMGVEGQPWCASFVSWCAAAAGIPADVIPRYAGAGDWRKWPGNGTFTFLWSNNFTTYVDYKPQVGDLCMYMPYHDVAGCQKHYNANSPTSHVVIVAWVSDTKNADGSYTFTTIERGSSTDGNVVASNTLTTKTTRGSAGTCACGLQTPAGQYSYTVQGFYRPNWSLMGPTYTAGDVYENIKWTIDTNGVLNITGTGNMPAGYTPWIDNSDFRDQVKSVVIGEGITSVSDNAFRFVSRIKTVTLPSTLKKIGSMAFAGCSNLQTINLPAGLEEISKQAFWGTSSMNAVQIPGNVKIIGDVAFFNCNGITTVTLSSKLTYIGINAFQGCANLTSITIENGVTEIPEYIFEGCTAVTSVTIPESVTSIGRYAFGGCTSLTDVFLSVSQSDWETDVTVGNSAFPDGVSLHFTENEKEGIFDSISWNIDSDGKLTIEGLGEMTRTPWLDYKEDIKSVVVGEGITSIAPTAFAGCTQLVDYEIPSSVVAIGDSAFASCTGLTDVTLPSHVLNFGFDVFSYCTNIESVTIEDGVEKISKGTFNGCEKLVSIVIPASVKTVSYAAFKNCTSLADVYLSVTKSEWENNVTVGNVAFPESVTFHFVHNDSENYKVESLTGTVVIGRFYAEVEVVNLTDREEADTIVIALYKDGEMIDYVYMKTDLPKGQTVTFGGMLQGCEGATLKAFVWDSMQGMKALSNVVEK